MKLYVVCIHHNRLIKAILWWLHSTHYYFIIIEDRKNIPKVSPFAFQPGAMIGPSVAQTTQV